MKKFKFLGMLLLLLMSLTLVSCFKDEVEGPPGIQGPPGLDGKEIVIEIIDGDIAWKYEGMTEWNVIISLEELVGSSGSSGSNGKSAYEIYLEHFPDYNKSEEEWIVDLISGNLVDDDLSSKYVLATDDDFYGNEDGDFIYVGDAEYVIIPEYIKGVKVTKTSNFDGIGDPYDTTRLFSRNFFIKGVAFENPENIVSTSLLFYNNLSPKLDLSELKTPNVKDMSYMFALTYALELDLSKLDTSNVTNMSYMFSESENDRIDVSNINTSNVVNMEGMFENNKATDVDLSNFITSKVTNMKRMFRSTRINNINLSNFDTSNVADMESMFESVKVDTLDLSSFDVSNVVNIKAMFRYTGFKYLDLNNFKIKENVEVTSLFYSAKINFLDISYFELSNRLNYHNMLNNSVINKIVVNNDDIRKVVEDNQINDDLVIIFTLDELSNDKNWAKYENELWIYISNEKEVVVPEYINDELVTSAIAMFAFSNVSKVSFEEPSNIETAYSMFLGLDTDVLDLSELDTSNIKEMWNMFALANINELNLSNFNTSNVANMNNMFIESNIKYLDLSNLDTSKVKDMSQMFYEANIDKLNLKNIDVSSVTNMSYMFSHSKIKELDLNMLNTRNVKYMNSMFAYSNILNIKLDSFDTTNVVNMSSMFANSNIKNFDLSTFDTSKVTNMNSMFNKSSLEEIDISSFDTSNVTDMSNMFSDITLDKLDLSHFNTKEVTDMNRMFANSQIYKLNISNFNTSNVFNMREMFSNLKTDSLNLLSFDTSNVFDMQEMFLGVEIDILDLSSFDISNVLRIYSIFYYAKINTLDISSFKFDKSYDYHNYYDMFGGSRIEKGYVINSHIASYLTNYFEIIDIIDEYMLATDVDFDGYEDGEFIYTGYYDYVIIPESIKGVKLTKTSNYEKYNSIYNVRSLFSQTTMLKGVKFENSLNLTNTSFLFSRFDNQNIEITGLDTSNVTNMSYMYYYYRNDNLDLRTLNTSNVLTMEGMFYNSYIDILDLSSFDTTNVVNFNSFLVGSINLGYARDNEELEKFNLMNNVFVLKIEDQIYNEVVNSLNIKDTYYDNVTIDLIKTFETNNANVSISWQSSNEDVISNEGVITVLKDETVVTLKAFITIEIDDLVYEKVFVKDVIVRERDIVDIKDFLNLEVEDIGWIQGIITHMGNYNAFTLEDSTGAISFRVFRNQEIYQNISIGDEVLFIAKKDLYNGLKQVSLFDEDSFIILSKNNELPNVVDLNDIDYSDIENYQSHLVNYNELNVLEYNVSNNNNVTILAEDILGNLITIKYDSRLNLDTTILGLIEVNDLISVNGSSLSWVNGPQIVVGNSDEITINHITEEMIEELLFLEDYNNLTINKTIYFTNSNLELVENGLNGSIIEWELVEDSPYIDLVLKEVIMPEEIGVYEVELIAVVQLGNYYKNKEFTITLVVKVDGESYFEGFNNTELEMTSGYSTKHEFNGDGNSYWEVLGRTNVEGNEIDGQGFILRRPADNGYIKVTLQNGISSFSFDYRKAMVGASERLYKVDITNGDNTTTYDITPFGSGSGEQDTIYTWNYEGIPLEGEVTIKIYLDSKAASSNQATFDNFSWSEFK